MLHPGDQPGTGVELDGDPAGRHPCRRPCLPVNRLADGTVPDRCSAVPDRAAHRVHGLRGGREERQLVDVPVTNAGTQTMSPRGPEALRLSGTNAVGVLRATEAALPLPRRATKPPWSTSPVPSAPSGPSPVPSGPRSPCRPSPAPRTWAPSPTGTVHEDAGELGW